MLYLIGLGLGDGDVSLNAVSAIKKCGALYAELYTSNWLGDINKLGESIGRRIEVLPREKVESDFLVNEANGKDIALLVGGDPLAATTHMQLVMDAKNNGVKTEIIHAPSIYTAIAETGMHLYKFSRSTTLAAPQKNFFPESPYDIIAKNQKAGLHTLVLLDIPMNVKKGTEVLAELEKRKGNGIIKGKIIACSKLGGKDAVIKYAGISELIDSDMDAPAVLVIPGKLNFKEEEALKLWE